MDLLALWWEEKGLLKPKQHQRNQQSAMCKVNQWQQWGNET